MANAEQPTPYRPTALSLARDTHKKQRLAIEKLQLEIVEGKHKLPSLIGELRKIVAMSKGACDLADTLFFGGNRIDSMQFTVKSHHVEFNTVVPATSHLDAGGVHTTLFAGVPSASFSIELEVDLDLGPPTVTES